MLTRMSLILLIVFVAILVTACYSNPQPPGLTPIPMLAPGAQPSVISAVPAPPPQPASGTTVSTPASPAGPTTPTPTASGVVTTTAQPNPTDTEVAFEPPNCGGSNCDQPGPAVTQNLVGNVASGKQVFADNCERCHGPEGKQGITNLGSEDGTVPALNPLDTMFNTGNPTELKRELDLYVEHGSHTAGTEQMPAWGDSNELTPQQIADVIAYIESLNGVH